MAQESLRNALLAAGESRVGRREPSCAKAFAPSCMPQTVTGVSPTISSRWKTRSSQDYPGRWSRITKCQDSAPHRSMYQTVCFAPSPMAVSSPRLARTA